MIFYKVKPHFDGKRYRTNTKTKTLYHEYVSNELLTEKQINYATKHGTFDLNAVEAVEVVRTKTYWFFGCRFAETKDIK